MTLDVATVISVTVEIGGVCGLQFTLAGAASPLTVRQIRSVPANNVAGFDGSMARRTTGAAPPPVILFGPVPCASWKLVPPSLLRWTIAPPANRTAQIVHGSLE